MWPFVFLSRYIGTYAEVAELADAQDLGSCGRKAVGVQLPPSAPKFPSGRSCPRRNASKGFFTACHTIFTCHSCVVDVYTLLSRTREGCENARDFQENEKLETRSAKEFP